MVEKKEHNQCRNEHRIISLEKENEIKKARLDHWKEKVNGIDDKIYAIEEKQYEINLHVTESIDELRLEIVGIHTTIKNISILLATIGCIITLMLAIPDLLALLL